MENDGPPPLPSAAAGHSRARRGNPIARAGTSSSSAAGVSLLCSVRGKRRKRTGERKRSEEKGPVVNMLEIKFWRKGLNRFRESLGFLIQNLLLFLISGLGRDPVMS